jgi:hypothetical protein
MTRQRTYCDGQIRRALIAYGEGKDLTEVAAILGLVHFAPASTLIQERRQYGVTHGGGVPAAVRKIGVPDVSEPEALRRHRRARRGVDLPRSAEDAFIGLLLSGVSIAEAGRRLERR